MTRVNRQPVSSAVILAMVPALAVTLLLGLAATATTQAATITLTASDTAGQSSFISGVNWSDGLAPSSGNDYEVPSGRTLRTPANSSDHTFQGDSLTIYGDGLWCNTTGTTATITVADLRFDNGLIGVSGADKGFTLAGNVTLVAGGGSFEMATAGRHIAVSSTIGGVGGLDILDTWQTGPPATGYVSLAGTGVNTYTGGTTVNAYALLDVQKDGGLGTGNVTVVANGLLKLNLGSTDNYINDMASLIMANSTNTSVNLAFSGTDTIAGLSFDGGSTYEAPGTWGSVGSDATHTSGVFSGSGLLYVVPEPGTVVLLLTGVLGLIALRVFRRRRK